MSLLDFLTYRLTSGGYHGYGIHSPYVYHLVTRIIEEDLPYYRYSLIERLRSHFLRFDGKIGVHDGQKTRLVAISDAVRLYSPRPEHAQLIFRLAHFCRPQLIVEVGCMTGICTLYLASTDTHRAVLSVTLQSELADLAREEAERVGIHNIRRICTTDLVAAYRQISESLPPAGFLALGIMSPDDTRAIIMMRIEASPLSFFIVLPKPHRNRQMKTLLRQLKDDPRVKLVIDIYCYALIIAKPGLQKENYTLQYWPQ